MSEFILYFKTFIQICIDISIYIATSIARDKITKQSEQRYIRIVLLPSPLMQQMLKSQSKYIELMKTSEKCIWNKSFISSFMPTYVNHVSRFNNAFSKHHIPYVQRTVGYIQNQL
jgi:hypothetical protein